MAGEKQARRPMSAKAPKPVDTDKFDAFVGGAVETPPSKPDLPAPDAQSDADETAAQADSTRVAVMLPSQMRQKRGPGRKKKEVRPWVGFEGASKDRMTLIIEVSDKKRLDYLHEKTKLPAQEILRGYIQDLLREDAEALFCQLNPDADPEDAN